MLDINVKPETQYCVPLVIRDLQIKANCERVKGRVEVEGQKGEPIAIVGYGPSLNKTWKQLKKFKTIISCSGATKFLLEKGVRSAFHCEVDPRAHKAEMIEPCADTTYLLASCVHKDVIDKLEGHNVKLWHVFANDGDSEQVIPRGEVMVTGGCDVGMRCMSLARLMGYTDFHIFGLDGCIGDTGNHAGSHPNQPKVHEEVKVGKKTFKTTHGMLASAQQVFHELNQLADVKFKFYGTGLIQEMAKTYKREKPISTTVAVKKPELISAEYKRLNEQLHKDNVFYGTSGAKHAPVIKALAEKFNTTSILDYGSGKGLLAKEFDFPIWEYDPCVPGKDTLPRPAEVVACTDVLEHIEPDHLDAVLKDLKRVVKQVGYFVIHTKPAQKTLADGRNAHLIQEGKQWWGKKLNKFFTVGKIFESPHELKVVVCPK